MNWKYLYFNLKFLSEKNQWIPKMKFFPLPLNFHRISPRTELHTSTIKWFKTFFCTKIKFYFDLNINLQFTFKNRYCQSPLLNHKTSISETFQNESRKTGEIFPFQWVKCDFISADHDAARLHIQPRGPVSPIFFFFFVNNTFFRTPACRVACRDIRECKTTLRSNHHW